MGNYLKPYYNSHVVLSTDCIACTKLMLSLIVSPERGHHSHLIIIIPYQAQPHPRSPLPVGPRRKFMKYLSFITCMFSTGYIIHGYYYIQIKTWFLFSNVVQRMSRCIAVHTLVRVMITRIGFPQRVTFSQRSDRNQTYPVRALPPE